MNKEIPSWLLENDEYEPTKDFDNYIKKSILKVLSVLSNIRFSKNKKCQYTNVEVIDIISSFIYIILISAASKNIFLAIMLFYVIFRVVLLDKKTIKRIIKSALSISVFSVVFFGIGALYINNYYFFIRMEVKVFLTISIVSYLKETVQWNNIIKTLKYFYIPDLFILILDMCINYIAILGDMAVDMLNALYIRSIGKNKNKMHFFAGIFGSLFLKSKEMSDEVYMAMCCRGFTGEYPKLKTNKINKKDILYILPVFIIVLIYLIIEVIR